MLQAMSQILTPLSFSDDDFGFDAHDEVAPGGHFFGAQHTMSRYQDAFYQPFLSDWTNYEGWVEKGQKDTAMRATEIWQQMLKDYHAPDLPKDKREALEDFVAKRKQEIGSAEI